jgi:hypothetical protein
MGGPVMLFYTYLGRISLLLDTLERLNLLKALEQIVSMLL